MRYQAKLKVLCEKSNSRTNNYASDADRIFKCFKPEIQDNKRANFKLSKVKDCVIFDIESEDSVALRATLNSITKLLTVYEDIDRLGK